MAEGSPGAAAPQDGTAVQEGGRAPTPRGPRGSRGEVRARITAAALRSFADHGLDGASTRSIAREADCDPALVRYYFASKQALFDQVTRRPGALDAQLDAMAALPHDERAAFLADVVETCWDDPGTRDFWRSLLRSSRTDSAVARQLEDTWAAFVVLGTGRGPRGDGRPREDDAGAGTAAGRPARVDEGTSSDAEGVGPEGGATGAVHAPDHLRTGLDAAAPVASRRLVDPDDAGRVDVASLDGGPAPRAAVTASRDERERTVTALASITGMLGAVHLWSSERVVALGGEGRSRALEDVLASCFRGGG